MTDKNKNLKTIYSFERIEKEAKTIILVPSLNISFSGISDNKVNSERIASSKCIDYLKTRGYTYDIPESYKISLNEKRRFSYSSNEYKNYVITLLNKESNIDSVNIFLKSSNLFYDAITSPSFNDKNNYEALETLGDNTLNKIVFWYFSKRFPQLNCSNGKELLLRVKTKNVMTESYVNMAQILGLHKFIKIGSSGKIDLSVQEDVFEAFFGALELAIDKIYPFGTGYFIIYNIISKILDNKDISLKYENLVDSKTTLKEIFDPQNVKDMYGTFFYKTETVNGMAKKILILTKDGKETRLCESSMYKFGIKELEKQAEFDISKKAIEIMKNKGITHWKNEKYDLFC